MTEDRSISRPIWIVLMIFFMSLLGGIAQQRSHPGPTLLVLKLKAIPPVATSLAESLDGPLAAAVGETGGFRMVDRAHLGEAMKELKLRSSGITDETMAEQLVGKQLGAEEILSGELSIRGASYSIAITISDVVTGEVKQAASDKCDDCTVEDLDAWVSDFIMEKLGGDPSRKPAGAVIVESAPLEASIYFDDGYQGKAPLPIRNVVAGVHTVRGEFPGHEPAEQQVTVKAKRTAKVKLELSPSPSDLYVFSTPTEALITLDGKPLAVTPWSGRIPAGRHGLTISKNDYVSVAKTVILEPAGTETMDVELKPEGSVTQQTPLGGMSGSGPTVVVQAVGKPQGGKPAIGVLKLEAHGDVPPNTADVLADYLSSEIFKTGKYEVVNRGRIDQVMKEFRVEKGLCDSTKCYAEIGKSMGAEKILAGSLSKLGETCLFNLKLIDITLIKEEFVDSVTCACKEDALLDKVTDLVCRMTGEPDCARDSQSIAPAGALREPGPGRVPAEATDALSADLPREGNRRMRSKDGAEVVLVPAGAFWMGCTETDVKRAMDLARKGGEEPERERFIPEMPRHEVRLSAFYIDRFEVTNEQYARFVRKTGRQAPTNSIDPRMNVWTNGEYPPNLARHPVVNVSWMDASAYCAWAGVRLPSEAEWEKAARGRDGGIFPWGNEWDDTRGNRGGDVAQRKWFSDMAHGYIGTVPVGSFPRGGSPYGAEDMAGNVWEWVKDWYGETYYKESPKENPPGPSGGQYRVVRGGSWVDVPWNLRAANRHVNIPTLRGNYFGFRCAQDQ